MSQSTLINIIENLEEELVSVRHNLHSEPELSNEEFETTKKRIRTIIEGIAATFGAKATLAWHPGPPSVVNDKDWTPFTFGVAKESGFSTVEIEPSAGGEDFAFYQQQIPGTFVDIGTSQPYNLHHPKFTVDDAALLPSAKFFALLAERALERLDH